MQTVQLIVTAALLLYLLVVVQTVELAVLETVFVLLGLGRLEERRQRVAEVHRADFAPLGGADLRLVSRPVVAHTAPHRDGLLFQVNVLPCESADLADPKPGVVGDLDGQESRILFLFQIVRQRLVLLKGDRWDGQPVLAVLIE